MLTVVDQASQKQQKHWTNVDPEPSRHLTIEVHDTKGKDHQSKQQDTVGTTRTIRQLEREERSDAAPDSSEAHIRSSVSN